MKINQILKINYKNINEKEKKYILKNCLNISDKDILFNRELKQKEIIKYNKIIKRVQKNIPLQYIAKKVNFCDYEFIISKNVLIPRFETENLVYYLIEYINKYFSKVNIIDIGTGSGVIGITLKKNLKNSDITCTDINSKALKLTKKNAKLNQIKIRTKKSNMLNNVREKYDVIVSNPPYLSYDEKIEPIVYNNEPHNALFAKNKGLFYYEEILKNAKKNLNKKNIIAFEIGCNQAAKISNYAKKYFPKSKIIIKKDFNNRKRYMYIFNNVN